VARILLIGRNEQTAAGGTPATSAVFGETGARRGATLRPLLPSAPSPPPSTPTPPLREPLPPSPPRQREARRARLTRLTRRAGGPSSARPARARVVAAVRAGGRHGDATLHLI
jgi:hypothetical protein